MRILVVNWLDRENPQAGGAEEHLHQIFGRLVEEGHQVTALVSGWPGCIGRTNLDGIEVHRTGSRYTFPVSAPKYYRRHLVGCDFDVVVEDLNKVPLFTPLWTKSPVLLVAHHLFGRTAFQAANVPIALVTLLMECLIPFFYKSTPTAAVSESTKRDLVDRGLSPDDIDVIPNGIDVTLYTPLSDSKTLQPTILFLGRLKRYKRVDLIIRAVAELRIRGIHVQLRVAGTGEEAPELSKLVKRLGVEDRVELMGFIKDSKKLELLQSSWVHVLPSSKEGWGISVMEAAACGTPSVASDAPGLRESVLDEVTGLLVQHGDVGALAEAIEALVSDAKQRQRMSDSAREFAESFSWNVSARRFEIVLGRVSGLTNNRVGS